MSRSVALIACTVLALVFPTLAHAQQDFDRQLHILSRKVLVAGLTEIEKARTISDICFKDFPNKREIDALFDEALESAENTFDNEWSEEEKRIITAYSSLARLEQLVDYECAGASVDIEEIKARLEQGKLNMTDGLSDILKLMADSIRR
jgi:hypothetical protein